MARPKPKPPATAALGEFGRRVRAQREALGLSQEGLAEHTELHWSYIGKVERGQTNPTLMSLLRLAGILGVDLGHLVSDLPGD